LGFDLVLGLSVFHHIVHRLGIDAVRTMLSTVAENTAASIFEMALAGEPPCWAASQPANPRQLLDGFAFVHEIARNPTHLSELPRPLYVASNRYWFLGDRAEAFDSWKTESHALVGGTACGTRRYFFGNGLVAKVFDLEGERLSEINRRDNVQEAALLRDPPPGFAVPKLLSDGRTEREAWLVREHVPGELLLDRIRSGISYDSRRVLADILDHLVKLESAGLYHDDIRTWNVLIGPDDRASLIDFGAISPARGDCVWPHDIFLAFLITVQEIANGEVLDSNPRREPLLNPATLPEPYRAVWRVFLEQPLEQWSFALLRDLMERGWRGEIVDPGNWPAGLALIVGALMAGCSKIKGPA
jgi:O-antigen chain-terminating methyltransferase